MKAKYFILPLFLTIFVGCDPDKGNALKDQISNIEKYLETESREYIIIDGVYKSFRTTPVTPTEPEPEPEPEPGVKAAEMVLQNGDTITINYVAQVFNSAPAGVYDTNIFAIAKQVGLDTLSSRLVPLKIKYGATQMIQGLRSGLKDSKTGESYSLFMPYTKAYGEEDNGVVPGSSAINFEIDVLDIKR